MNLLKNNSEFSGSPHGAVTWLARGIEIDESAVVLLKDKRALTPSATETQRLGVARRAERLSADVSKFISDSFAYGRTALQDDDLPDDKGIHGDDEDKIQAPFVDGAAEDFKFPILPLPSGIEPTTCKELQLSDLVTQELRLRVGQANDALHAIRLAIAEISVLFRTEVRHAANQASATRAWGKVHQVDNLLSRHVAIYKRCRIALVSLGADSQLLRRYRPI